MTRIRCTLGILIAFALTAKASAQIVVGTPIAVPNGIDFRYRSSGLRVNGFMPTAIMPVYPGTIGARYFMPATYYPYGPYYPSYPIPAIGVVEQRVTVRVMPPPVVIVRRIGPDLSGIDLDVEPASKIWGEKPALAKKGERIGEAARIVPAPEKKIPPIAADPAKPPMPPAKPKAEPIPDSRRVTGQGVEAFQKGEYNLAILRFRQAGELAPLLTRPLFLEGQALIAVGKYHEAVDLIEQGLKRLPDWPTSGFHPKADLYDNDDAVWVAQRKQLEEVQRLHPKNAEYLFLLGYLAWFDGQRNVAVEHFQAARALAPDGRWSDLFLKVTKK